MGTYIRFEFDHEYLQRLRAGDPETAEHFAIYFGRVLSRNLRCRCRRPELIEDIRQETLRRVLEIIRKTELNSPSRLEAFVSSVCNNVLFEYWRSAKKHSAEEPKCELVGSQPNPEQAFTNREAVTRLRQGLSTLPARDREVLRLAFLEERDNSELSTRLQVSRTYARVLVHRAIAKLRESLLVSQSVRPCFPQ